ncbi:MAG: hypothetical protein Hens2KO_15100 [Henriciella sp.]
MSDTDLSRETFPWLRSGFDLEGYVGALAAWLVGILLGILWAPLFWIGFIAAIVILLATRTAERTVPDAEDIVVAPSDGMVVSVGGATAPDELRLEGASWTRVRVSVGPTKTNGICAPIDGAIDHVIRETGDPAAFAATKPDRAGLTIAYVALESGDRSVGMRYATGGLGPRLEIDKEAGDAVRLGRGIGTLRLGGWYDLYVPSEMQVRPVPGQTLIGSETIIGRFGGASSDQVDRGEAEKTEPTIDEDLAEDPIEAELVMDEDDELTLEALSGEDETADKEDEDVSEMFARLKKEARKIQDDD